MNKSIMAVSLVTALCSDIASAAIMTNASFNMYSPSGVGYAPDTTVTGSIGGGTWSVASTAPFFGVAWSAHGGIIFGPGTYDVNTANVGGGVGLSGTVTGCGGGSAGCYEGVVVGAGQVGGHILFNWGTSLDMDVVQVWDVSAAGIYTSTDVHIIGNQAVNDLDGIPGLSLIDGPFGDATGGGGSDVNFNFTVSAVPVPAAVWLFGSGLLGLIGLARRKAHA